MNAPAGETRRPVTVDLEVEFEGFSGKEHFPDALMYPKGLLLRTRSLKPVGTPASFTVLGQRGSSIGGRGQVVFSRWQDQGPRRPAGLGIRIDEWAGDSEARAGKWFEPPSQFDLVDAESVPTAPEGEPAVAGVAAPSGPGKADLVAPQAPAAPAPVVPEAPPPAIAAAAPPAIEPAASGSRWMAEDVPAAMPDLSLRFGKSGDRQAAAPVESAAVPAPPIAEVSEGAASLRPGWEPVPQTQGTPGADRAGEPGPGGVETVRIPRATPRDDLPRAGSHVTRQDDRSGGGAEVSEPFRPVWSAPVPEYAVLPEAVHEGAPPSRRETPAAPLSLAPGGDEVPLGRDGNVAWLSPARPRVLPWILAGVLVVLAAGGGYWLYVTRFAPQPAVARPPAEAAPAAVTQVVEPAAAVAQPPAMAAAGPAANPGPAESAAAAALAGAKPAEPAGARAAAPAAQPPSAPARRFSALTGVSWSTEGDGLVVRLSLDGAASERDAQQFRVAGPPREVVKLRGCRPTAVRRFEVRDARLVSVRVGEQPGGDLHVVLDLADAKVSVAPLAIEGATLVLRLRR
jgi:hypothetical protein